jgi:lysozyme family protein
MPGPVPVSIADDFTAYIMPILVLEGGGTLTDDPADGGHVTIWGITEDTARAAGYTGAMADMTQAQAIAIYRSVFWQRPGFDRVDAVFKELAQYMLETGINLGPDVPSAFLQRGLNVMSNQGSLYPNIEVDGRCGALTRAALAAYRAARPASESGDVVLMGVMRALAVETYIEIAEANPSQQVFAFGWLRDRALGVPTATP